MTKPVGLIGGTFDPIHMGHLWIAESALRFFDLSKIYFIPAGQPPHKADRQVTPKEHRLKMTQLAIQDDDRFEILTLEIEKPTPSYTIETLQVLRSQFETRPYFMMGMDSLLTLHTWEGHQEFGEYCQLGVVPRLHPLIQNEAQLQDHVRKYLPDLAGSIHWLDMPIIDISSTLLRQWLENKQACRYFLKDEVWHYIQEQQLY